MTDEAQVESLENLTLRDLFAFAALIGLAKYDPVEAAQKSYRVADEMVRERMIVRTGTGTSLLDPAPTVEPCAAQ